jgi:hypothetical protein
MRVGGADGHFVGTVVGVEGDRIKLARNHVKAGGISHWVPLGWVALVIDGVVARDRASDQARRAWWPSADACVS